LELADLEMPSFFDADNDCQPELGTLGKYQMTAGSNLKVQGQKIGRLGLHT
jgi:hypothetical protein